MRGFVAGWLTLGAAIERTICRPGCHVAAAGSAGRAAGVMQEMWALFAVYQAICRIVGIAVHAAGVPPARISFPHALAAATDTVAAFSP
jgi:hypothetical protein